MRRSESVVCVCALRISMRVDVGGRVWMYVGMYICEKKEEQHEEV